MVDLPQFALIIILTLAIICLLYQIKYSVWENNNQRLLLKIVYSFLLDHCIGWLLFALKFVICNDNRVIPEWGETFNPQSICLPHAISVLIILNAIITFNLIQPFVLALMITIILVIIEVWAILLSIYFKKDILKANYPKMLDYSAELSSHEISNYESIGYNISEEVLGFGYYGTVYKCEHKIFVNDIEKIEELAVKVIDVKKLLEYRFGQLIHEEEAEMRVIMDFGLRALRSIDHKNIAKFEKISANRELGELRKLVLFSKLSDFNLDYFLEFKKPNGVGEDCARYWFRQLCDAIDYLHKDVMISRDHPIPHSNIKPENILLFKRDEMNREMNPEIGFNVKLADCGIASLFPKLGKITTKKNYYISPPENIFGRKNLKIQKDCDTKDFSANTSDDIYSLGVVLVLLLKGNIRDITEKPKETTKILEYHSTVDGIYVEFSPSNVKQLPGDISQPLYHLLQRMLNRLRAYRFDIIAVKSHPWLQNT